MSALPSPVVNGRLLYVNAFLIDSGASVSVIRPAAHIQTEPPVQGEVVRIRTISGEEMETLGYANVWIEIGPLSFQHRCVMAEVDCSLLGADFLAAAKLWIDVDGARLLHPASGISIPCSHRKKSVKGPRISVLAASPEHSDEFKALLARFPSVTALMLDNTVLHVKYQHEIDTGTEKPIKSRACRLSPEKEDEAKGQIEKMLEEGILFRSQSEWASPMHMVRKADGSWRIVCDFTRLNAKTRPDAYPVPNLLDFSAHLAGSTVFSKMDLTRAYLQVPMKRSDRDKTAIITPFGLFEYHRMPFGIKNAAQAFQRLIHDVLAGLDFVYVYLDDILIFSASEIVHRQHVEIVLERLQQAGLQINPGKCVFAKPQVEFLGHQISSSGIEPAYNGHLVKDILKFPSPTTPKETQRFLGMCNFYRRFMPRAAAVMAPMYVATKWSAAEFKRNWNKVEDKSFSETKALLASTGTLAHPSASAETCVATDASELAMGGVLQQRTASGWRPLAYFSQNLSSAQRKYSTFDRELLAVATCIKKFCWFLEARPFHVITDHLPLTTALSRKSDHRLARQSRALENVAQYTSDIRYVQGQDNVVADALSRPPHSSAKPSDDDDDITCHDDVFGTFEVRASSPRRCAEQTAGSKPEGQLRHQVFSISPRYRVG